jgi:hypothetical protein
MNTLNFPAPDIIPLKRLHVYDSLMMNAQRWLLAHEYHRRRQNLHYQSLNQPGIVCGLGVSLIDPPDSTDSRFRDYRWLEIQPGIAIDVQGNVIVVDEAIDRTYRIAAKPPTTGSITVYIVISYVEPEAIHAQQPTEVLQEQFRFDQKTTPPSDFEIELCRIQLSADFVQLTVPPNVFFPELNQIDVTHRLQAQTKPIATVHAAQVHPQNTESQSGSIADSLCYLTRSTPALYPVLQGIAAPASVSLQPEAIAAYDLLCLAAHHLTDLSGTEQDSLQSHLQTGGAVLIELPIHHEFAIVQLQDWITQVFQTTLIPWHDLPKSHPLRSTPFLFAALPTIDQHSIQLWCGGGIVLVVGELTAAWTPDEQLMRSRYDIRTAQEFGINVLQFAWQRRHLTHLIKSNNPT